MPIAAAAALLLAAAPAPSAAPMPVLPPCTLAGLGKPARSLRQLPAGAAAALARAVGGKPAIADAGQPYNVTDVVIGRPLPFSRFLRAYPARGAWIVWYEQGGIAYRRQAVALVRRGGRYEALRAPAPAADLCAATGTLIERLGGAAQ